MKKIVLPAVILTFALTQIRAQVSGNYQWDMEQSFQTSSREAVTIVPIINNNEIAVTINGLYNVAADNYVAVFNIVQVGETMDATDQLMNTRISSFKQKLKGLGIDTSEIRVDVISFVPKFEVQVENRLFSKTYNEVPAGFELQKNIAVRYKNSVKLEQLISAAATSEIYDIVKVDYFIASIQKSLDSLRQKCIQEVKTRVKSFEAIGFKLDTLKKTMEDSYLSVYPQSRYFSYRAFSRPSLVAAKKKTPTVNEIVKTTSKFYNQVPYDKYDIVINPVILEPVVQISYTITVKYFLKPEEKQSNIYTS